MAIDERSRLQKSLLLLYESEIKNRLALIYVNPELGQILSELVSPQSFIINLANEIALSYQDQTVFADKLWTALMDTILEKQLFVSILAFLAKVEDDSDVHGLLLDSEKCINSWIIRHDMSFGMVLDHFEEFLRLVSPTVVLEFLKRFEQYQVWVEEIETVYRELNNVDDRREMNIILFRTIPHASPRSMYDFLKGACTCSPEASAFVHEVVPKFNNIWERHNMERSNPRGPISYVPVDVSAETLFSPDNATIRAYDLNFENFPTHNSLANRLLRSLNNHMHDEKPIILRDYQKELCESALRGDNVIINAPTGSGKTVVAAYIMKNHLNRSAETNSPGKVLFMTPNKTIIEQQERTMKEFLGHRYEVASATGDNPAPLLELINAKDVLVVTPMLIVNLLEEDSDIATERFSLDKFTMIIFDECHNAAEKHPYNQIMSHYHKAKDIKSLKWYPQIIGLTASLGVGKTTKTQDKAQDHIVKICGNLDCKKISTVQKNMTELLRFSPITLDDFKMSEYSNGESRLTYREVMGEIMEIIEKGILNNLEIMNIHPTAQNQNDLNNVEGPKRRIIKPPADRLSQEYLGWISLHKNRIVPELDFAPNESSVSITEGFIYLDYCFRSIDVHNNLTSNSAYRYINKKVANGRKDMTDEMKQIWDEHLFRLEANKCDSNPMIDDLVKLIMERHEQNENFRAIVFVKTRECAMRLPKLLRDRNELQDRSIRTEYIIGSNKSKGESDSDDDDAILPNVKKSDAQATLEKFASGETKVLVATSVAEEGLDIAKCNLVVKYNYASNEIAHVQRRGRGRAKDSQCVLLTNDSKLKEQEEGNIVKERLMHKAIDHFRQNEEELSEKVEKQVEELRNEIRMKVKRVETRKEELAGKKYEIHCRKCNALLTNSIFVKIYKNSQYCIADPDFWTRIRSKEMTLTEQEAANFHAVGTIFCKSQNCGVKVGRIIFSNGTFMPILKAEAIVLYSTESKERKTVKKWNEIPEEYFNIDPIRKLDFETMRKSNEYPNFAVANVNATVGTFRASDP